MLLARMEAPRREKRGSIRVATMIANKGLPVELEPITGFSLTSTTSGSISPAVSTTPSSAALAAAVTSVREGRGEERGLSTGWSRETRKSRTRGSVVAGAGGKGLRRSDVVLGAAGKMRADASPDVLPFLEGFVPAPVMDMLAVSATPRALY